MLLAKLERYSINSSDVLSLFEKTYSLFSNNSVATNPPRLSLSASYPASWMELDVKSSASSTESIPEPKPLRRQPP